MFLRIGGAELRVNWNTYICTFRRTFIYLFLKKGIVLYKYDTKRVWTMRLNPLTYEYTYTTARRQQ